MHFQRACRDIGRQGDAGGTPDGRDFLERAPRHGNDLRVVVDVTGRQTKQAGQRGIGGEADELAPLGQANVRHRLGTKAGGDTGIAERHGARTQTAICFPETQARHW